MTSIRGLVVALAFAVGVVVVGASIASADVQNSSYTFPPAVQTWVSFTHTGTPTKTGHYSVGFFENTWIGTTIAEGVSNNGYKIQAWNFCSNFGFVGGDWVNVGSPGSGYRTPAPWCEGWGASLWAGAMSISH